jgi:hypothetical protein
LYNSFCEKRFSNLRDCLNFIKITLRQ